MDTLYSIRWTQNIRLDAIDRLFLTCAAKQFSYTELVRQSVSEGLEFVVVL